MRRYYSVADSRPLRSLDRLREVKLLAASPTAPHGNIGFSDIASDQLVKVWISNAPSLADIGVLKDLPSLREVRLIQCPLESTDRRELNLLSKKINVSVID